jgi:Domain of unknown function (DUF4189)
MIGAKRLVVLTSVLAVLVMAGGGIAVAAGTYAFGQKPGPTGWSSGSAYNYSSQAEAQNQAMSRCRARKEAGEYCKIIATVTGKCFAVAVQDNANGYGWNTADTLPEAQRLAMNRCTGYGKSCSIRDGFCDSTASISINPPQATPPQAGPAPTTPAPTSPPPTSPAGGGSPACQKFPDLC